MCIVTVAQLTGKVCREVCVMRSLRVKPSGGKPTNPMRDGKMGAKFDYSRLSADFAGLAKPAQRALISHGIFTPADLARKSIEEVSEFHGIGPSALPLLRQALRAHGLKFRE